MSTVFAANGYVVGGWSYVWVAYGVTWAFLVGYTLSLWLRWRDRREEDR